MNQAKLITGSLRFFARSHLGTLLGAAVGTAVLVGALAVGDSVRESLRRMALVRLGKTEQALSAGDRFFRADLARDLEHAVSASASVLQVAGTVANQDGSARANRVQVLGVDNDFWNLAEKRGGISTVENDSVALNQPLARQLRVGPGDEVVLRVHKPSLLSRESPISPQEDFSTVLRLKVQAVLADEQLGNFSLQANQIPPFNAFVARETLQAKLNLEGKANLLLTSGPDKSVNLAEALQARWQLTDAELELRFVTNQNVLELRSPRIFIDAAVSEAAVPLRTNSIGILTYFVNEFRVGDRSSPYSMITAAQSPMVPAGMRDDEILINRWLSEDLQAEAGDAIALRYFVVGDDQRLEERTNSFQVHAVVPMEGLYADRELMPEFPGISKAEKTEDWDAGFPIDMTRIRPKDEEYWKQFRGTPKAFVTLAAGQKMWSNRFGNLTAIRFPATAPAEAAQLEAMLLKQLNPATIGLAFQPVREQALAASTQAQDFGQLFLGFSFFLIAAALILIALLYAFSIEQRREEVGTLLAIGLRPAQVRRMLLLEGAGVALVGGIAGAIGGIFYAKAMLHGLTTIWRSAVGTSSLQFHVSPTTLIIGAFAGALISIATIWLVLRKQARSSARELLADTASSAEAFPKTDARPWAGWILALATIAAILLTVVALLRQEMNQPGTFFGAGMLLLIAGLAGTSMVLKRIGQAKHRTETTVAIVGFRSTARRKKRSLATVALLASGCFLIVSVGAFRLDVDEGSQRLSGSGGFDLIGETTLPVVKNLNAESGRDFFGLNERDLAGVEFVQFRVREGDDASCLNLNRPQKPRLLGVDPTALHKRGSFRFAKVLEEAELRNPWLMLQATNTDEVPAIADAASIQWALKKKVGDTLTFVDERGTPFKVRIVGALANSVLQGSLIIDEKEFLKRFPGETGYRMFLIDTPSNTQTNVSAALSRGLRDVGMELTPTTERLAAFNAVQNTYLSTFQVLGGLGLLLGTIGLGIVVLRNVLERRGELALLSAVGFRRPALAWLVLSEHAALLMLGFAVGLIAAVVAILPALLSHEGRAPFGSSLVTFAAILFSGLLWTWLATKLALRGELLKALRNE